MRSFWRVLMVGTAAMAVAAPVAALPVMAQAQTVSGVHMANAVPTLNLSATGKVNVVPDQATINFAVMTEAPTAQEAMQANAGKMTQVIAALRRAGLADRDIQTSGLNLSAQYDYVQNESPRLRGYQAQNQVTVVIRDLSKVGQTADAVVAAGVNQIDGIAFGLQDATAAENQARLEAVRELQAKASLYAQALGKPLLGLQTLTEEGGYRPEPRPMMARMASASAEASPVEAGELTVEVRITGVYNLGQ